MDQLTKEEKEQLEQMRFKKQQKQRAAQAQQEAAHAAAKAEEATKAAAAQRLAAAQMAARVETTEQYLANSDAHGCDSAKAEYFTLGVFKGLQEIGDVVENAWSLLPSYDGYLGRGPSREEYCALFHQISELQQHVTLNVLELVSEQRVVQGERLQQLRDEQAAVTKKRKHDFYPPDVLRCDCKVNCFTILPFVSA